MQVSYRVVFACDSIMVMMYIMIMHMQLWINESMCYNGTNAKFLIPITCIIFLVGILSIRLKCCICLETQSRVLYCSCITNYRVKDVGGHVSAINAKVYFDL